MRTITGLEHINKR